MTKLSIISLLILTAVPILIGPLRADGIMIPNEWTWRRMRERSMINEPEQKAVVHFSKGKEQLIISPSYSGPTSEFAWVVPVPARPKVEIMKGAIFHELATLTMPRPDYQGHTKTAALSAAPGAPVRVLERKTVGAYDVSVLSATDGKALMKWLTANKYHMPSKAAGPIQYYVNKGWTFVASRIKAPQNAGGLSTGTLAPLKLTFTCKSPVYPLRLSSVNPRPFAVLVYIILPTRESIGSSTPPYHLERTSGPAGYGVNRTDWKATLMQGQTEHPTLARLCSEESRVFVQHDFLQPKSCTSDYVWTYPKRQARR